MTRYKFVLILLLLSTFSFVACANDAPSDSVSPALPETGVEDKTDHEAEVETQVTTESDSTEEPISSDGSEALSASEITDYTIESKVYKPNDNIYIEYPQISGLPSKLSQEVINQSIEDSALSMVSSDVGDANPLNVTYEIKYQTLETISILFVGTIKWENGEFEYWNPITIDLNSSYTINLSNLVKTDSISQLNFNSVFKEKALESGYEFEQPQEWMGFYLEDDSLVFYFKENDFADAYTLIFVPIDLVGDTLNPSLK